MRCIGTGNRANALLTRLLGAALQPLCEHLHLWLTEGRLQDPTAEFPIVGKTSTCDYQRLLSGAPLC